MDVLARWRGSELCFFGFQTNGVSKGQWFAGRAGWASMRQAWRWEGRGVRALTRMSNPPGRDAPYAVIHLEPVLRLSDEQLFAIAGSISAQDLELMKEAIEQGCEQVIA